MNTLDTLDTNKLCSKLKKKSFLFQFKNQLNNFLHKTFNYFIDIFMFCILIFKYDN